MFALKKKEKNIFMNGYATDWLVKLKQTKSLLFNLFDNNKDTQYCQPYLFPLWGFKI